jgi:hypothetical protein
VGVLVDGAHLDTTTGAFSLASPAKRGERAGERGKDTMADKGRAGIKAGVLRN